jgi:excisionase family DNA binding protein
MEEKEGNHPLIDRICVLKGADKRQDTTNPNLTEKPSFHSVNNVNNDLESLMTVNEVCVKLGVRKRYIYKLTQEGRIPYIKVGKYLRFRPSDIEEWLSANSAGESSNG